MKGKCEVCGSENGVNTLYICACDEYSPLVTLCEKCKEKFLQIAKSSPCLPAIPKGWSYEKYFKRILQKEEPTMQVSYNGFTGNLVRLEQTTQNGEIFLTSISASESPARKFNQRYYNLSIYDSEKQVTHSFTGVKLEDVKFLGGAVAFDG